MSYTVTLGRGGAPLAELEALLDPSELMADVSALLKKVALVTLRHLVKTCSVDTGRARGGFLPLLEKYGVAYGDVLAQPSPLQVGRIREPKGAPGGGVEDGKRVSSILADQMFTVQIANNVEYVEFINAGVSGAGRGHNVSFTGTFFMDAALIRAAEYIDEVFRWYVDAKLAKVKMVPNPAQGPGDIR